MLELLLPVAEDPLLRIIADFRRDSRPGKIDLGVGVYKTEDGHTPVMAAVKKAEAILVETQESKAYLGLAGDEACLDALADLTFAPATFDRSRLVGIQTPGASAALRLASDLAVRARPDSTVLVGTPTWSNHLPIFTAAGLAVRTYRYSKPAAATVDYEAMFDALATAPSGTLVLLQGCCHNPTGIDLAVDDWIRIAGICCENGLLPLIDMAYNGLGEGFATDMLGVAEFLARVPEALMAVSCSKNFGLYRERTGALFALAADENTARITRANLFAVARSSYSMPPDHGAAVVRTILQDSALRSTWLDELGAMRARIRGIREQLGAEIVRRPVDVGDLRSHRGMFSLLPLTGEQVATLRDRDGIYMAGDGRINVASMRSADIERFATALERVLADA